tara:strand:- start:96 stop:1088 length:993 start_codon:yes stop_codon:yes gene_type:complete
MATLAATHPTLQTLASRMEPDGKIAAIIEILNETNEVLDDIVWVEANDTTGHTTTVRTGLPAPTWRKLNYGVQPTRSTTSKIKDAFGMMESYSEIDKSLAELNGNTSEFRLSEDVPHMQGMNEAFADKMFYGNDVTAPEEFMGLGPRFNDLSASNGAHIVDGGGTGADNASIWMVVWGPNLVHGIYPKGSQAGLYHTDLGEVTLEDAAGGFFQGYRSHYKWDCGLSVRDWRAVVRIANIDRSLLTADLSTGANLAQLMFDAVDTVHGTNMGRPAFYMDRTIKSMLGKQSSDGVKNSTLTHENVGGKQVSTFQGIPIRRVDALKTDEARIT